MVSALFSDSQYQSLHATLDVAELRQKLLSANVANVNTPGFRRQELRPSFEAEFQRALEQGDVEKLSQLTPQVATDEQSPSFRGDGNNVNLEREMIELAKNSTQYEVSATVMSKRLQMLRMAVTGKA